MRALVVGRAIAAAALVFAPFVVATSIYSSLDVDVVFAKGAASLSDVERKKVVDAVERIRREDWCTFEVAITVGHADASEGEAADLMRLSELRAAYVANVVRERGIPAKRVYEEGKGGTQPLPQSFSARAEIYFKGGVGGPGCKFPKGPSGFREWN